MGEKDIGFSGNTKNPSIEEEKGYLGRFLCVHKNGNTVLGILSEIDRQNHHVYFNPCLVGCADDTLHVEKGLATRISLPLEIIRPMKGTIEDYATKYNAKIKKQNAGKGEKTK